MTQNENANGWNTILAIAMIVLGVLAIALPLAAGIAVEFVFGVLLVLAGVMHLVFAFQVKRWRSTAVEALLGVFYLAAGILLVLFPVIGLLSLTIVLAVMFLLQGMVRLAAGVQTRERPGSGWILLSGALSILLGVMIVMGWPATAAWAIGLIVGIELIFTGVAILAIQYAPRRERPIETS